MKKSWFVVFLYSIAMFACGGGGTRGGHDVVVDPGARTDPGPSGDLRVGDEASTRDDGVIGDPGNDVGHGDFDVDTVAPDVVPDTDVPMDADGKTVECVRDDDCNSKVRGLGPCEVAACVEGECRKAAALDGAACDDGDPCTTGDKCAGGICAGNPVVCDTPPPDECIDARTLKSWHRHGECNPDNGKCEYGYDEKGCEGGCVDGVCLTRLGLLQAELTSGGPVSMDDGDYGMSCVMPGWYDSGVMDDGTWVMSVGFEP